MGKFIIDISTFKSVHQGGKDEVAFNLLRGFIANGHGNDILVLCRSEMISTVHEICAEMHVIVVDEDSFYRKNIDDIIRKNNVKAILFTNKYTPRRRFAVPTIVIPHDIQAFLSDKIKGIHYRFGGFRSKFKILMDFYFRDRIIAISEYDMKVMRQNISWAGNKIEKIYNPIKFNEINNNNKKKYITALNIQWLHKNTNTLIEAFISIADKVKYDLLLIGRHPENFKDLSGRVNESGLGKRVIFTGYISDEELNGYISETAIYVNPSYFEGFGMTAVEMMGNKIPTIVAKETASPETTMGMCRYYYPADNINMLAEQILDECDNPTTGEKLNEAAKRVREKYSYEKISEEYWDMMNRVGNV